MSFDPLKAQSDNQLFASIPEEMGVALERAGFSPNIKERRDYSCALFDARGRLIAQAAHIPVHLGAMPSLMRALAGVDWEDGDTIIVNDAYCGGTHLPDISLVTACFHRGRLAGFVANRAHHADIGGAVPGSMPVGSCDHLAEGLRLPPLKLVQNGRIDEGLLSLIKLNSRAPEERNGDLRAQLAANQKGIQRFQTLLDRLGLAEFEARSSGVLNYSERMLSQLLASLPAGEYEFSDQMDGDGISEEPISIRVKASVTPEKIRFDFTGSSAQRNAPLNATEAVTRSACFYVLRCLLPEETPTNEGSWERVEVIAPTGSIVNARFPAPVSGGNVETSQRIVDVLCGALAQAAPERFAAASQGTMNNTLFGGWSAKLQKPFAYYETLGGGCGASLDKAGASGLHSHMTNTRNTPVEALESALPVQIPFYRLRENSGGSGAQAGGMGIERAYRFLEPVRLTLITERRVTRPYGLEGGEAGQPGQNELVIEGETKVLGSKASIECPAGSTFVLRSPGGGGYGKR